jgi:hypothetical protein
MHFFLRSFVWFRPAINVKSFSIQQRAQGLLGLDGWCVPFSVVPPSVSTTFSLHDGSGPLCRPGRFGACSARWTLCRRCVWYSMHTRLRCDTAARMGSQTIGLRFAAAGPGAFWLPASVRPTEVCRVRAMLRERYHRSREDASALHGHREVSRQVSSIEHNALHRALINRVQTCPRNTDTSCIITHVTRPLLRIVTVKCVDLTPAIQYLAQHSTHHLLYVYGLSAVFSAVDPVGGLTSVVRVVARCLTQYLLSSSVYQ